MKNQPPDGWTMKQVSDLFSPTQVQMIMIIHRKSEDMDGLIRALKNYFHTKALLKSLARKKCDADFMAYAVAVALTKSDGI